MTGFSGDASAAGGKCTPSYPEFVPQCCAAVDLLGSDVERLKQQGEQCGSEVERLRQQGEQLASEFERLKELVATRSSFRPTGNRAMPAWGNSSYSRCQLPFSWTELNKGYKERESLFRTGGLGRHMQENVYESWVGVRGL
jgi:FtsZ-binding cell division protein ZapB